MRPLFPFCGGSSRIFAPVGPPLAARPICSSGALLKAKIDSSRSISSPLLAPRRLAKEAARRCRYRRSAAFQFDVCQTH